MANYRIAITMEEHGYVEVEASDETEAYEKAGEELNNGGFVSYKSECYIGKILCYIGKIL